VGEIGKAGEAQLEAGTALMSIAAKGFGRHCINACPIYYNGFSVRIG